MVHFEEVEVVRSREWEERKMRGKRKREKMERGEKE
jgi:hypothetical protein